MDQVISTSKRTAGRPVMDISQQIGSVYGRLTILGRATTGYGRGPSGLLPKSHIWVNCSCACGKHTASNPKAIRLDHILDLGPSRTMSCGCRKNETACENAEFHTEQALSAAKIASIFHAFCRKPFTVAAIAKRYAVAAWMVGASYRLQLKALAVKFGASILGGRRLYDNIAELGSRAERLLRRYVLRNEPAESFGEISVDDATEPWLLNLLQIGPAFESSCFQLA